IVIPPAIFFYYSTLFDSRFKTLQQNRFCYMIRMMNGDCVYYNWDKVSNNALEELLFVNKYVYLED
ncbi:hypothetical protein EGK50_10735, partial [Enterococcus faecium]